ncbi:MULTISPECIES: hypothetical protein [Enterobacter cloacae complex]|uniref:hypothetical protein n=1 Tax=Enterobacter cloacae complex TaxID=354276 RepID=UPI001E50FB19|nr:MULTISPECIES: hypothetical protein [Enterobacter cloacae complex]UYT35101.1 hypothetical protein OKD03_10355 [Enterobacter cloacae]MCE1346463.1 hypothetical protein [Enterobacter hormaechei]MCE1572119.1 hypothetical protein [Enterobacter hormaechei]MCE1576144.1 hypothetical protein [Enterobacter hormaechei]MCE1586309.1 hypothetical protein [Enterobacter hormaechei]
MTNTQIVTELQPRMTREKLIDAARKAAPLLPAAYGWMVNELATRLDVTSVALCEALEQRKELAKENSALKFGVQSIHDTFTSSDDEDVFEAIKLVHTLPTTATDVVARELAADSIDEAVQMVISLINHQAPGVVAVLNILNLHSSNLRAGNVKHG